MANLLSSTTVGGSAVITTSNIGSQSVSYASTAGNASTVSSITGNTNLLVSSLAAPGNVDGLTTSNFRSTLFGTSSNGWQISTARWNNVPGPLTGLNAYGTMIAWSGSDTHGFVAVDYAAAGVVVGGGNANNLNWTKKLAFADGTGASGTWSINVSGNASTATNFSTNRTNYKGVTDAAVAGQLMWKNYGNNHTIFDASNGTSPDGTSVNNTNSQAAWTGTYPTLMGWNGSQTYGVRVDSARIADTATTASALTSMNISQFTNNSNYMPFGSYSWTSPVFGQYGIKSNLIDNVLYSAADRFEVFKDGVAWNTNSPFNLNYDSTADIIPVNTSRTYSIVLNTKGNPSYGIVYTEGNIYLSFYYVQIPASVSGRVRRQNGTWENISGWTNVANNVSYAIWRGTIPGGNWMVEIEITINSGPSVATWFAQWEYVMGRPGQYELGIFNKAQDNSVWRTLYFLDSSNVARVTINSGGISANTVTSNNFNVSNAIYFGAGNNYLNWTNNRIYSNVGIESTGTIHASGGNSSNWNTAYSWGNHASAGYITSSGSISGNAATATTANALTSMNISQFTNNSGYLTSLPSHNHDDRYYTESEINSQISGRLYQASVGTFDFNAFNGTGLYRGSTGSWSNRPTSAHNGGAVLQIDTHPGNYHSQLYFDTGADRLYLRNANAGTWGSWLTILHSGNYTSYSPSLTGSGASGTWGINVTGSAGSVAWTNVSSRPTALSQFTNDLGNYGGWITGITSGNVTTALGYTPYNSTNPNGYITSSASISGSAGSVSGLTLTSSSNGINPDSVTQNQIGYNTSVSLFGQTDGGLYSSAYSSSWIHQIYGDFRTGQIAIRGKNSGTWQSWRTVLDSSNYTSYSPSLSGSGASGTWGISVTGNAGTVGGYAVSGTVGANTVVIRDVNGYIYAHYINSNVSETENPTINSFYTSNGDGWLRKSSVAHVKSQLGLGSLAYSSATIPTNTNQLTNGAGYITSSGSISGNAATATNVAWTGVTGRPTALSQFSNDLGNYGGFLTSLPAHDHDRVFLTDSRGAVREPSYYDDRYAQWDFQNTADTNAGGDTWHGLLTVSKWTVYDASHRQEQLAFTGNDLKRRTAASDSAWGPWKTILDSNNFSTWAAAASHTHTIANVTGLQTALDGKQASGSYLTTSGKAADSELFDGTDSIYFVKGNGVNTLGYRTTGNSGANSAGGLSSGFYDGSGMSNMPTSDWYHLIVNAHNNSSTSNQYEFHIATPFWDKSNFYVRSISPGDVGPWRTLIHNGNIGSQSVSYASTAGSASTATTATTATVASQLNKFGDIYGQDWNTYYVQDKLIAAAVYGHSGANRPNLTYDYGVALSYGEATGPRMQMYFPENSGNIGTIFRKGTYRTGWNGNWSTWKTFVEQEGNLCTIVGGNGTGLEVHGNVGYNQDPLTYFLLRGQADTSWKAFKVRLTGDAGGQDIEFRRIAENGADSRMWYVPRGGNTVNFEYPIVQPSDSRLKDNITPISTPVEKIKALSGVEFDWNSGEQVGTHDVGLIAQDVEAVLPEAVTTQEDGYKNLSYTKVIPLLVEAMKEQQIMIEALRAEIELLKNK